MHFMSFIINLLGWLGIGLLVGHYVYKNTKKRENLTPLIAGLGALLGGMFSFANHGMWIDVGIDFYNLFMAFFTSFLFVVLFLPESRPVFNEVFSKITNLVLGRIEQTRQTKVGKFFTENFGRNITSSRA